MRASGKGRGTRRWGGRPAIIISVRFGRKQRGAVRWVQRESGEGSQGRPGRRRRYIPSESVQAAARWSVGAWMGGAWVGGWVGGESGCASQRRSGRLVRAVPCGSGIWRGDEAPGCRAGARGVQQALGRGGVQQALGWGGVQWAMGCEGGCSGPRREVREKCGGRGRKFQVREGAEQRDRSDRRGAARSQNRLRETGRHAASRQLQRKAKGEGEGGPRQRLTRTQARDMRQQLCDASPQAQPTLPHFPLRMRSTVLRAASCTLAGAPSPAAHSPAAVG